METHLKYPQNNGCGSPWAVRVKTLPGVGPYLQEVLGFIL